MAVRVHGGFTIDAKKAEGPRANVARDAGSRSDPDLLLARNRAERVGADASLASATRLEPGEVIKSTVTVGTERFERVIARTHWIEPGEDLGRVMRTSLGSHKRAGDWAIVSEKATVIAQGLALPAHDVRPGPFARWLAGRVRPTKGSRGLSIPEKMQLVVSEIGLARTVAAVAAAAVTRPFGVRGAFYVVAGDFARGVDGMRPPLEDLLLPPLDSARGKAIAQALERAVGMPVAIVDINDRGGSVRCVSGPEPSARLLMRILRDNPLGQRAQQTPMGLVRRL